MKSNSHLAMGLDLREAVVLPGVAEGAPGGDGLDQEVPVPGSEAEDDRLRRHVANFHNEALASQNAPMEEVDGFGTPTQDFSSFGQAKVTMMSGAMVPSTASQRSRLCNGPNGCANKGTRFAAPGGFGELPPTSLSQFGFFELPEAVWQLHLHVTRRPFVGLHAKEAHVQKGESCQQQCHHGQVPQPLPCPGSPSPPILPQIVSA